MTHTADTYGSGRDPGESGGDGNEAAPQGPSPRATEYQELVQQASVNLKGATSEQKKLFEKISKHASYLIDKYDDKSKDKHREKLNVLMEALRVVGNFEGHDKGTLESVQKNNRLSSKGLFQPETVSLVKEVNKFHFPKAPEYK